jgi:hypothetical protein
MKKKIKNKNNNKHFSTELLKLGTILFEASTYHTLRGIQICL